MTPAECERLREVAPELALGIADGEDRARALEHLAGCAGCRAHLERLSSVADDLLLFATAAEPPPGFEQRAVGSNPQPTRRPALLRRFALPALAAVAAAAIATVVAWGSLGDERRLADSYRETLAVADGEYFAARPLENRAGSETGHVFGYQGSPSWVFCVVHAGSAQGTYDIEITASGDTWSAGEMEMEAGKGTWAQPLGVDLHDVRRFSLIDRSTGETLVANW